MEIRDRHRSKPEIQKADSLFAFQSQWKQPLFKRSTYAIIAKAGELAAKHFKDLWKDSKKPKNVGGFPR